MPQLYRLTVTDKHAPALPSGVLDIMPPLAWDKAKPEAAERLLEEPVAAGLARDGWIVEPVKTTPPPKPSTTQGAPAPGGE